jgi:hypothetical protein
MHPVTGWMDPEDVYEVMIDPTQCADHETAARYYLNRPMSGKDSWIAKDVVERQTRTEEIVEPGTAIALGFDGSLRDDATVLIGCRMTDGFLFPIDIWAKPAGPEGVWWEVPRTDVLAKVQRGVRDVRRDPHVLPTRTSGAATSTPSPRRWAMSGSCRGKRAATPRCSAALDRLRSDLITGVAWHSGHGVFVEHFANAYVRRRGSLRLVRKEHDQSDRKIDSVVGAALAYEARADAITAGWGQNKSGLTRVTGTTSTY